MFDVVQYVCNNKKVCVNFDYVLKLFKKIYCNIDADIKS